MNIVFVSHCDFRGNSAMHIFSIANGLLNRGVHSWVLVPNDPESVTAHGTPLFRTATYSEGLRGPLLFPDGRGPDLVHAWTPRESVRKVTEALAEQYSIPYVVHLEDNEEVILESETGGMSFAVLGGLPPRIVDEVVPSYRSHPVHYPRFLAAAGGLTALMDTLLEFNKAEAPATVFWPGFDSAFAETSHDLSVRRRLGVKDSDLMLVYNGTVHQTNRDEVGSLVLAVAALRRGGLPAVLVKTGVDHVALPYAEESKRQGSLVDLGYRPRGELPALLAASDILVQPGRAGAFNDYRFPSKLPEFLVSGRPVLLPRTNIGRFLQHEVDCILLERGDGLEIADRIRSLWADPVRMARIGEAGREFALRELDWGKAVTSIQALYDQVLCAHTGSAVPATGPGRTSANDATWCPKLIAFYLPQFHPIPENDAWWGEGFTEWSNVRRAKPNFAGHYQPQVPTELGYYDLRDPGVMDRQAALAKAHGIQGFCYYYYWFNSHRLLERPLDMMLRSGKPDFPFCICWANENWTRRWDGSEDKILMEQGYKPGYAEQLMLDLVPTLKDPRYIKVEGAPLVLVYRADLIPDPHAMMATWRHVCADQGIPGPHVAMVQSFGTTDPRPFGFDAAVDFPPHTTHQALISPKTYRRTKGDFRGFFADYEEAMRLESEDAPTPYLRYRGVMPGWDNTPRRQNRAYVYVNSSIKGYETWLRTMVERAMARAEVQEPLVFLNAWNEWGEGAYLEPDEHNGRARLHATRRALCLGITDYFARKGLRLAEADVERVLVDANLFTYQGSLDQTPIVQSGRS